MNNYENLYDEISPEDLAKQEGERTRVTENVLKVAREIDPENKLQGKELVEEVCRYVRTMTPSNEILKESRENNQISKIDKWDTTADELLSEKNLIPGHRRIRNIDGCTQISYITRALLLAKGIPSLSVDTIEENWILNNEDWNTQQEEKISGHYFLDVYDEKDKKWYTINPGNREERFHEHGDYSISGSKYIEAARGRDTVDMGFTNAAKRFTKLEKSMSNLKTIVSTINYQGEQFRVQDISSAVLTEIAATYPFLNEEEYENYMKKATKIELNNPIKDISNLLKLLNNPHASLREDNSEINHENKFSRIPTSEMIDDVLYIKIPTFFGVSTKDLENIFLPNEGKSTGLIIDLRSNEGGRTGPNRIFAKKHFIKEGEPTVGTNIKISTGGGLHQFDSKISPVEGKKYEKPIVILTSNKTFSSAERFVAIMKAGSSCTVIGTETAGGSAYPVKSTIEYNGKKYAIYIPTRRFYLNGQSKPLEETKIEPDITYDKEDIVDFAIKYIKSKKNESKI